MDTEPTAEEIKTVVQPFPREQARREREARERKRHEKELARRKAESDRHIREAFLPVLEWFAENGNQDQQDAARAALSDWQSNRQIWEQWGAQSGYIGLVQKACANFDAFRAQFRKAELPSEEAMRVRQWVFAASALIMKRKGLTGKKVAPQRRKVRKSS